MSVHVVDEQPLELDAVHLGWLAERVLASEGVPDDADVSVILVTDDAMAGYNRAFMERNGPTDVLAFPLEDLTPGTVPRPPVGGPPIHLGDVVIAPSYVGRQAEEHGATVVEELSLMLVHGMLHLLGYDHVEDDEAEQMESRERTILAAVGMVRK